MTPSETAAPVSGVRRPQILARRVRRDDTGIMSWLTTVDHKRIGILYLGTCLLFLLLGGVEALLMRLQLAVPDNDILTP